ncbi:MAG: M20 family metallo-hydrolase [Spirochaetaceae bacterium]|jgi:succinyl-diaminopimelate desuccinylase|nr:M20 family metallo-hydrolase [Spirochaetaceae bacterium]
MVKETIFNFIEKNASLVIELETELTKRPAISPESGGEGELEKCQFLEKWLKAQGITRLERLDAPDEQAKGGLRPNLIATIPGKNETKRLWIMSHLDVVPPGEASLWKSDPWQVVQQEGPRGTVLIGRGVEDNQQGLCSSVLAALALTAQGITPPHPVKLLFVADEEMGSAYGIDWILKNHPGLFRKDDMILIPDGGDSRGETIEIAEKNLLWLRLTTTGAQAHGSRPDQGINAHLAGADLAVRLHNGLSEHFSDRDPLFEPDYSTFQPTKKEANVPNVNTIPGEDVFYMDMRILPRYPVRDVLKEVDRIKGEVEGKYQVKIAYTIFQSVESRPTSPDAPLVKFISGAAREVYGVETRPIGIGGGTVGAYLRNAGIDSVVWGRMDDTAHQPNEYAVLENILGDAKVMALLMTGER